MLWRHTVRDYKGSCARHSRVLFCSEQKQSREENSQSIIATLKNGWLKHWRGQRKGRLFCPGVRTSEFWWKWLFWTLGQFNALRCTLRNACACMSKWASFAFRKLWQKLMLRRGLNCHTISLCSLHLLLGQAATRTRLVLMHAKNTQQDFLSCGQLWEHRMLKGTANEGVCVERWRYQRECSWLW